MQEPSLGIVRGDLWEQIGDGLIENILGSCFDGAEQQFQFGPSLFDWIQVWRIGWQVEQFRTCRLDPLAHTLDLVRAQIIEHYHVTRS